MQSSFRPSTKEIFREGKSVKKILSFLLILIPEAPFLLSSLFMINKLGV
jgi:hypothetical protein